jgi:hypothetical protein
MRKARIATVALATLASIPLLAQEGGQATPPASPPAVQVPTTSAPAQPGNASSPAPANSTETNSPAATNVELKPVKGELVGKLDSKTAKTGDSVVVKTRETVKTADGTEIPKGTKLVGHVTLVQPHSTTNQNSELAVQFDRAELKGGQTLPIHSMIQSVAPAPGEGETSSMNSFGTGPMVAGGGAPSAGGGMTGSRAGAPGASPGTATTTSVTPMASGPVDQNSGQNGSSAGRVVAGSGPNAIRTTDIPNVYLASNAAGPASGTLFAAKDNVHLDGGTQIVLDIAATNSH